MKMVSSRPLLFLSLPGVAFILGVYWYRRRNKQRANSDCEQYDDRTKDYQNGKSSQQSVTTEKNSVPLQINTVYKCDEENSTTKQFGKSAPIQIIQNTRICSINQMKDKPQNLDTDVLKAKMQNVELKRLKSIDEDFENLSSPVDLPDSGDKRAAFLKKSNFNPINAPVVIKATKTPKISPENSFLENKYIACTEENNNVDESKVPVDIKRDLLSDKNIKKITNETHDLNKSSPPLSLCSEESGDSGKGSSLPRSEETQGKIVYEFLLPSVLIGPLYGKKHSFVRKIREATSTVVTLHKTKYSSKVRICKIEGPENGVHMALDMIRKRLPVHKYPNFTMQRIYHAKPEAIVPLSQQSILSLQLKLIEGINNDVVVSSIVNGGHLFVQHPLHPSHPSLAFLQKYMYESYNNIEAPKLRSFELNAVCVMPINLIWYRVQLLEQDARDKNRCLVKFLDFGGYSYANFDDLRQISSDFMAYPFQATECVLSNIEPLEENWSPAAAETLGELTQGLVLQAQVAGYNKNNVPEIYLFACLSPNNFIFINKELVARNLARWIDIAD